MFISSHKAALVYYRKRLRRAVSFYRRGAGGLAQRSPSLLSCRSTPTCPRTCKLRFLTPHHLKLARYSHRHISVCHQENFCSWLQTAVDAIKDKSCFCSRHLCGLRVDVLVVKMLTRSIQTLLISSLIFTVTCLKLDMMIIHLLITTLGTPVHACTY